MTTAEIEERNHLAMVTDRLRQALEALESRLTTYARNVQEQKKYFWESKTGMDSAEKAFTRQAIDQAALTGEAVLNHRKRVRKLLLSPYFGRFDFARNGGARREAVYVGVHHFTDEAERKTLVYDWRAPISTMFYDYEIGPASYEAPSGEIDGEILLKRQFRIRDGRMEFMLETALNIVDDVLQQELSRASEDRMKQIVATIQREQNAIIRNDEAQELIIQGVAGSGKTSIALHRIAYLLYRYKESLTSKDILIISPNRVFADYISNVLPELGEESVTEISMETLASELLDHKIPFQTFYEQTALLLENHDEGMRRRIEVKSSPQFPDLLNEYVNHVEDTCFRAGRLDWRLRSPGLIYRPGVQQRAGRHTERTHSQCRRGC
jgi:DNA helicase-2/ATP-dependent DNA helicase PcrA